MSVAAASVDEVRAVVKLYSGAPDWWCGVFVNLGWGVREVRAYMDTAYVTPGSPLREALDATLCVGLKDYAAERGMDIGVDVGMNEEGDGRFPHTVRQVLSLEEQSDVVAEVSGYARLKFQPHLRCSYVDHSVARVVRQVNYACLRRMVPRGAKVLEVGANISSVVLAAQNEELYHAFLPVRGSRDAVRQSVDGFLNKVARGAAAGYSEAQAGLAKRVLDGSSKIFSRCSIADSDEPGEYILAGHSDYNIDLDDMPSIMARHGAKAWFGVVMRVRGLNSVVSRSSGEVPVLGASYKIDRAADTIEFHFKGKASFSYRHKFSSYVKREERNDYRWHGLDYDYVYTKLPVSTESTLMYAIYRVRKSGVGFSEPVFHASGQRGRVQVTSVKAVRAGGRWVLGPHVFSMERLALDKVLEYRRSLGSKGSVVETMRYMMSVRLKFVLNGVSLGVSEDIDLSTFESAAVFVELYVTAARLRAENDFRRFEDVRNNSIVERGLVSEVAFMLRRLVASRVGRVTSSLSRWSEALRDAVIGGMVPCVSALECEEFVSTRHEPGVVDARALSVEGCVCRELRATNAALAAPAAYTDRELSQLRLYRDMLLARLSECKCYYRDEKSFSSVVEDVSVSGTTETLIDSNEEFFDCESGVVDVDVVVDDVKADAVREYAAVLRHNERAVDSDAVRDAVVLFRGGKPSALQLSAATTPRRVPFLVRSENGRLVEAFGERSTVEVGAVVDVTCYKVRKVGVGPGRRRDVAQLTDGWHYTSTALKVYNGVELADAALGLLSGEYVSSGVAALRFDFVVGPFGCGKTRSIVDDMVELCAAGRRVAYASATNSSVDKVVKWLDSRGVDNAEAKCATLDSALLARAKSKDMVEAQVLYVDEAPMAHFGQLVAVTVKLRPQSVVMYGDFFQIPYCSFTAEMDTPLASLEGQVTVIKAMYVLHRTPYDVLAMWNDVYSHRLKACRCCEHVRGIHSSVEVVRIGDTRKIPKRVEARYLVFTHAEKDELKDALGLDADVVTLRLLASGGMATVHEDQGGTYDEVILVRTMRFFDAKESPLAPSIYNRQPYVLVATTRHKVKFTYYTMSDEDDLVCKRIRMATDETERSRVLSDEPL